MKTVSIAEELKNNSYPGRGIIIGRTPDGKKAVTAYFIMGRSENSRNRVFVEEGEGILSLIHIYADAERGRRNGKKPFTIVMPPPNITGQLHMGHALDNTMQDILIRYKRMQGYEALWQPGTDHAAIATEVKVINKLKEQGIDKHDLGREGFLEKAWEWKEEYGSRIVKQLHKLGSSADWDRERFTMDEGCSEAVLEVFTRLYEKGYIYKGSRIINWCPVCQTSISDAEVEHEEQDGFFWHRCV